MILFFDRCLGTGMPLALRRIKSFPCPVEMHQSYFAQDADDDVWLPKVAQNGWTVITQDQQFHRNESELYAIKSYGVGAFYLWGASATQWEQFRVLVGAWHKIAKAATDTTPPYVYRVTKGGRVIPVKLP